MKYILLTFLMGCSTGILKEPSLTVDSICKKIDKHPDIPLFPRELIETDDVICFDRKEYIELTGICLDHMVFNSSLKYQCFMDKHNKNKTGLDLK